jgi:hypothetical protein
LDLPARLKQRGVHPVFHASLLRIHVPSDDRLFPGRLEHQVADFDDDDQSWEVDRVLGHQGAGHDTMMQVRWASGDVTWLPYYQISHLKAMGAQSRPSTPQSADGRLFNGHCAWTEKIHPHAPCPHSRPATRHHSPMSATGRNSPEPQSESGAPSRRTLFPYSNFRRIGDNFVVIDQSGPTPVPILVPRDLLDRYLRSRRPTRRWRGHLTSTALPIDFPRSDQTTFASCRRTHSRNCATSTELTFLKTGGLRSDRT